MCTKKCQKNTETFKALETQEASIEQHHGQFLKWSNKKAACEQQTMDC